VVSGTGSAALARAAAKNCPAFFWSLALASVSLPADGQSGGGAVEAMLTALLDNSGKLVDGDGD
jgi:hypothetical protein